MVRAAVFGPEDARRQSSAAPRSRDTLGTKPQTIRDQILDSLTTGISGIPWGTLGVARAAGCATLPVVTESFPQRLVLLGGTALLCAVLAIAAVDRSTDDATGNGLTSAPAPASWNTAFAGSRGPTGDAQRTTCGHVLAAESLGVTHPVLPCRTKVVLRNDDTQVLTEVIDHALVDAGRQLEVTEELAGVLELEGTSEIEWRFATEAGD